MTGSHTYPLHLSYHSCPECGKIIESRADFTYQMGELVKNLDCPRCGRSFTLAKKPSTIGPIMGSPPKPEVDW